MSKKLKVLVMKDKTDDYNVKKDMLFDLPMKLALVGRSQISGKSNLLGNMMILNQFYGLDFKGKDIFIVSPTLNQPKLQALIKYKEIPELNLFNEYDEDQMLGLYQILKDDYEEMVADDLPPNQKIIIFDDVGFSGALRKRVAGFIDLLACNGRHYLISSVVLVQKYTQLSPTFREQLTGLICFACSFQQLEFIVNEHNTGTNKRLFVQKFREATKKKHDFFVINYSNDVDKRYIKNFEEFIDMD